MLRVALVLSCALIGACSFSSYQSARMLPQGASSVGIAVNSYSYNVEGESPDDESIEVMASHGISDTVEIGGKIAWFSGDGYDVLNFLATPKVSIIPNQLAFVAPTGFILFSIEESGINDSENIWMTTPGVVYTMGIANDFVLDLTGKLVALFQDDFDDYNIAGAANVGFRFAPAGQAWSVGPEIGFMYDEDSIDEDDTGYFLQFGLGFHYQFGATNSATPSSALPPPGGAPPPPPPM